MAVYVRRFTTYTMEVQPRDPRRDILVKHLHSGVTAESDEQQRRHEHRQEEALKDKPRGHRTVPAPRHTRLPAAGFASANAPSRFLHTVFGTFCGLLERSIAGGRQGVAVGQSPMRPLAHGMSPEAAPSRVANARGTRGGTHLSDRRGAVMPACP